MCICNWQEVHTERINLNDRLKLHIVFSQCWIYSHCDEICMVMLHLLGVEISEKVKNLFIS